jgi:hypothetical protein
MTAPAGRRAARPSAGWRPASRRDGCQVEFVSEDGSQRKVFDFSGLPGNHGIREELAAAFEAATGPLGTWKRLGSARNLPTAAQIVAAWAARHRPGMASLGQLSRADARLLALSLAGNQGRERSAVRSLLGYCPHVTPEALEELARPRIRRANTARQPYSDAEHARICVVARAIVRRARDRIREHRALVDGFRAGQLDHLPAADPLRCLAAALEHCDRTGDIPRSAVTGAPDMTCRRAHRQAGRQNLPALLHPTAGEAWALAVLLAALTGWNAAMLETLPASYLRASAPDEPGIALVGTSKPRRGRRSENTLPLAALPAQLRPPPGDKRAARVRDTSLTTAFGVYALLTELTGPARQHLGSTTAFAYYAASPAGRAGGLHEGLPVYASHQRKAWLSAWLTGDPDDDALLTGISLDRLRKTYLRVQCRPTAHTPATYAGYLRRMSTVTTDSFQVVRDALDEQVAAAVARRRLTVITRPSAAEDAGTSADTVLGRCDDFRHSPLDHGGPCRHSFLDCLDCPNARSFPRHLPRQLAVRDALLELRGSVPAARWAAEYAGRAAQLDDILRAYEPAQVQQARAEITEDCKNLVTQLFHGDLDTP